MKVLHLIDSGGLYGAEIMLLNLVQEQIKSGLNPIILSVGVPEIVEKPIETEAKKRNLPVYKFRMRAGLNPLKLIKILKFAKQNNIDILHSHGYKFNILIGVIPKYIRNISIISTLHGYTYSNFPSKKWIYNLIESFILRFVDGVVFVSDDIKKNPILKGLNVKNEMVILNGIDYPSVVNQASDKKSSSVFNYFPRNSEYIYLGAIGRLSQEKGFGLLIDGFVDLIKINPNLRLLIIGEGELQSQLEKKITDYNLNKYIKLPGFVNPVYRIMNELDVIVMPSYTEGLPITLLEACILNKQIVASSVGGIDEVLKNYTRSITVPPGDIELLKNAIIDLITKKNSLSNVGDEQWRAEKFDSKTMEKKYNYFYKKVLQ